MKRWPPFILRCLLAALFCATSALAHGCFSHRVSGKTVTALANYAYTVGAAGNRLAASEQLFASLINPVASSFTRTWQYDALYRLTNETVQASQPAAQGALAYSYDPLGYRLARYSTRATPLDQSFSLDANSRRLQVTGTHLLAAATRVPSASSESSAFSAVFLRWVPVPRATNRLMLEVSGLARDTLAGLQSTNWPATHWPHLLAVYIEQPGSEPLPMLGEHQVQAGLLRFVPAFPLEPGLRYRAVFDAGRLPGTSSTAAGKVISVLQVPARPERATTTVTQVYPSADVVPENLLKFYVHFSAPMSRGNIYEHIRLLNEANQHVELPFLELAKELWSPDMMRLTLFIDPGRIKREVKPLQEIGPALVSGRRYVLVISGSWKDANGSRMKQAFVKRFTVGPPDRDPPDPRRWAYQAPPIRTREPLAVDFGEPMDSALALRMIHVVDGLGRRVPGQPFLAERERLWKFLPLHSWKAGRYTLVVESIIEDLAGNRIGRPFEVEISGGTSPQTESGNTRLPFELR